MSARLPSAVSLILASSVAAWGCEARQGGPLAHSGPCGRGKARACQCEDGAQGIAQCLSGDDWGECVCGPTTFELAPDAAVRTQDAAGAKVTPEASPPEHSDCESTFDFRAHGSNDFSSPYRVPSRTVLPGSASQRVCFYFRVPYVVDSVALGFSALLYETAGVRSWMLYGLDATTHRDGEVGPCNGAEPGAYLLAAFAPGVSDILMPEDVGLALPYGARAGMVLEVQYEGATEEVLDRTGVRVCAARRRSREHTASVHFTGSQGICIPPGAHDFVVSGSCEPRTDLGSIHVLDVWPSMHQHGRRMEIIALRADGTQEVLHDAPFAFEDQQRFPARDLTLWPGDTITTRCYFDNDTLIPIPFGETAEEETCFGFITAWPAGALSSNSLGALGNALGIDVERSCLNPVDLLRSCNGAADGL